MVHALLQVRRILRPGGWLINIHDLPAPHVIEVHLSDTIRKVGWLMARDDFEAERSAFNALAQVVSEGHFDLDDEREFSFRLHVDGLDELQGWLSTTWESALLTEGTTQRIEKLISTSGQPAEIVIVEPARMTKLRASSA
jgi:hypothetical protein